MPIVLYRMEVSPPSRAVVMLVELLGLKVELKEVNTLAGDQLKPEFVQKNPLHKVPFIEDGEFGLADSHAILTYLVSKYGADKKAKLYPSDLRVRATVDQKLFYDTTLFTKFGAPVSAMFKEKAPGPTQQQISDIEESYGHLEKYLDKSQYLAADHVTLADISCVAYVSTLNILVPIDTKYVKLTHWFHSLREEEWYQKGNAPGLAKLEAILKQMQQSA